MKSWLTRTTVAAAALAVTAITAPAATASDLDWHLLTTADGCITAAQNLDWCGPTLTVPVDVLTASKTSDGLASHTARMTLTGPNGAVPLLGALDGTTGLQWVEKSVTSTDPAYSGPGIQTHTPTGGMPSGTYTAHLDFTIEGRWWCSPYNSKGCSWIDDEQFHTFWTFTYTGSPLVTAETPIVDGLIMSMGVPIGGKPAIAGMATFVGATAGDKLILQIRDNGKWRTMKKYTLTAKNIRAGGIDIHLRAPSGRHKFRAYMARSPYLTVITTGMTGGT